MKPFAEQQQADQYCQQRRSPAGDRIDDGELAAPVGDRERDEVDQFEECRGECQQPACPWEPGAPRQEPGHRDWRQRDDRPPGQRPGRQRQGVLRCFEQRIPGGVEDGRKENERQDRQRHERSLGC